MTMIDPEDIETQSDFDMPAASAEISSDLFGQGGEEEGDGGTDEGAVDGSTEAGKAPETADTVETVEPSPQSTEEGGDQSTSAEVQELGAPKTWTKEALAEWATISPRAQQEILKREEDFLNGIGQYKEAATLGQAYDSVVEPYKPILAAEGVDPVQMFQSFAANHYLLTRGTPEQKVQLAATMLRGYDIPLPELLNYIADTDEDTRPPVDPVVAALKNEVDQLKNFIGSAQKESYDRTSTVIRSEIDTFASDPAHPYFNEVAADIGKLFESGLATSLPEAYEKAVYANPITRQKEIDRLTAEKLSSAEQEQKVRKDKRAKSMADSVETTPKSRDGTAPVGTMDDTLRETMAAIESRG